MLRLTIKITPPTYIANYVCWLDTHAHRIVPPVKHTHHSFLQTDLTCVAATLAPESMTTVYTTSTFGLLWEWGGNYWGPGSETLVPRLQNSLTPPTPQGPVIGKSNYTCFSVRKFSPLFVSDPRDHYQKHYLNVQENVPALIPLRPWPPISTINLFIMLCYLLTYQFLWNKMYTLISWPRVNTSHFLSHND